MASLKEVNTLAKKHVTLEGTTTGLVEKMNLQKNDYEARLLRKYKIIWRTFFCSVAILLAAQIDCTLFF